ncbi:signal peptidase II [Thermomicrobium sp. 4228-Ro]|uniref:signal peptidase II n=1 Tax=Thermomicrobium sp. 4228-Ro TaxID=2993937 RepID=UPI0022489E6A|nr:signal peptidase II [Thermomicrobium sp. 4228-Ro]MCX2727693.1 signal peptidase II [Thermomicrobium sp. 4228-Ro]
MRFAGWEALASVAVGTVLCDQFTKALVLAYLGPNGSIDAVVLIPGLLRLFYVENTGAAFGLFQGRNPILAVLALGVVLVLVVTFRYLTSTSLGAVALGLQLGGAIGNLIDRFRHGFVVDFIDLSFWPTFNVADSAITIGVLLLLVLLIRSDRLPRSDAPQASEPVDAEQQAR